MHTIEPYYNWRDYYIASEDKNSPFFNNNYDEFKFSQKIYNYFIHPQWDNIESSTLFLKVLQADYVRGYAIIELIGEWNDCLNNDIMLLKTNLTDCLSYDGIDKFILIGENILNFHASDDCYYEEWKHESDEGWIVLMNFREHVIEEMREANIHYHFFINPMFNDLPWRKFTPDNLCDLVEGLLIEKIPKEISSGY